MAKRNSTSKQRLSKNSIHNSRHQALHEAIEAERTQLSKAQSLLQCLYVALEYADDSDPKQQGYFPDVVEIAMTLVRESVNRLDSVYIRPLVEAG
ncbi:MAG: hypothetical protein QM808_02950 [Steroidobacteraceae bacterium]